MTEYGAMPGDQDKWRKLQDIALRKLANGTDPVLAEMAREVRSGRMTLREAATGLAYRDAFAAATQQVLTRMRGMSREDLAKGDTDKELDELIARHEHDDDKPERPEEPEPDKPVANRDEYDFNQPLARRTPPHESADPQPPSRARWQRRW